MNSPACCWIEQGWHFLIVFYRWLKRIKINVHQQVAYWRNRICKQEEDQRSGISEQKLQTVTDINVDKIQIKQVTELKRHTTEYDSHSQQFLTCDSESKPSSQNKGGSIIFSKTPRVHRTKLTSIFRRLSLRNFMDYCVAALNEASSSSCSNKLDLSSRTTTVWLLGCKYDLPEEGDQLIEDIKSKLWITYRRNFPPLDENTRYTTDRGFGCMIRCGQMVLANALLCKNLTRDWRWSADCLYSNPQIYSKILKLFQDREDCPYSIHQIVRTGHKHEGKNIGEWFGPNTIAQALKRLSSVYLQQHTLDSDLTISIDAALDNIIVIDEIKSRFSKSVVCSVRSDDESVKTWIPGILFIQLRLGLTKINPLYFAALKKTFQFKNSLGIIGGRPNHALYLVGYTEDDIIYLDPHNTQQYIDLEETTLAGSQSQRMTDSSPTTIIDQEYQSSQLENSACGNSVSNGVHSIPSTAYQHTPDATYHCSSPEKMSIDRLDPSLALCFYFNSESEFNEWCNLSQEMLVKSEQAPMFEITKSRPSDWGLSVTSTTSRTVTKDRNNKSTSSSDLDEEFEILT